MTAAPRTAKGRRTACRYGHPFTPENTRVHHDGSRQCKTCYREQRAAKREARKLARQQELQAIRDIDLFDDLPWASEDAVVCILAAMVTQAERDYATNWHRHGITPASVFLRSVGLLRDDGTIDRHGYGERPRRVRRVVERRAA